MDYPFIEQLQEQLILDSFSIFCGAGATADLTKRKWEDIFHNKTKRFYEAKLSNDIYLLSDLEKNYYNKENFYIDIKNKLTVGESVSNHIQSIIKLNLNQIWTTNFDEIIESAIKKEYGVEPIILSTSKDLLSKNINAEHVVYKLNGTIQDETTMVLTKTDFFEYFKKQRLFFEILKRQLVLDSFLFIGYSFQDDLVLNALREIKDVFPNNGQTHYRFVVNDYDEMKSNEDKKLKEEFLKYEQLYFLDKYNIKTIQVDKYNQIDDYLSELYRRFCNHNILFCGSFRNIDNNLRLHIENIIDIIIYELYRNKFNVYSGNGRGLGEIIVAQAKRHARYPYNRFINRPLIFTGDSIEVKENKNKQIEKDCNTMLIFCGQDEGLTNSANVRKQFKDFIDKNDNKLVIPIPSTGYAAKEIFFSEDYRNSYSYRIMHSELESLVSLREPTEIAKLVVGLIRKYRKEP
ncbi:MAG: SIR2 family protein [Clostridia bacterium]|nr:SIR2 family protein [Clostridia bacterium]